MVKVLPHSIQKFLVVSHVRHYRQGNTLYAYAPYVREMNIWADLFPQLLIAAPLLDAVPPKDCLPFSRQNIRIIPQRMTGGDTFLNKVRQILALPGLIWNLGKAMRQADAVHVRCPGNLGLLGILLAPLFTDYMIAKFAGSWNGHPKESLSYRLQRALLKSAWWRGPVTVYGQWPGQPRNVVNFFTSVMTDEQMARAKLAASRKKFNNPLRVLFVGRLSKEKNVDKLLSAVARLKAQSVSLACTVIGVGPMRPSLEAQAAELNIADEVRFEGGVEFEQVLEFYEKSDVLVLASETEGWGKALTEAMAYGLVCIGSDRGMIRSLLSEGRGIVVQPGDVNSLVNALLEIARAPENYIGMSARASVWAQSYSLEGLRVALRELLKSRWQIQIHPTYQPAPESLN